MPNYPASLDSISNPTGATNQNDPGFLHSVQHGTANDILEILEAKLGITDSPAANAPVANRVLASLANGKSGWGQVISAMIAQQAITGGSAGAASNIGFGQITGGQAGASSNIAPGTIIGSGVGGTSNITAASIAYPDLQVGAATAFQITSALGGANGSASPVGMGSFNMTTIGRPCLLIFAGFASHSNASVICRFGFNVNAGGFGQVCVFTSAGTGTYHTFAGITGSTPSGGSINFQAQFYADSGTLTIGGGFMAVLELRR